MTRASVRGVLRGGTPTHARLRDRLVAIALATVGFDMVCAALGFLFEHHQKQPGAFRTRFGGAVV